MAESVKKPYALAISATKVEGLLTINLASSLIQRWAVSQEEALGIGLVFAKKEYPDSDGWGAPLILASEMMLLPEKKS